MFVVCGREDPFKVKVAEDDVFFCGVRVFNTEAEMGYNSSARSVGSKALLFLAQDLAGLNIFRCKDDDTCGPQFIDRIRQCDRSVIFQRGCVLLF